ncbi:Fic family protein [Hymenobacter sp. H14-R3]|uniref:Fic family protein n=1 Tax=Hymenobacter sp. H14-R3 TaxID=3046308 RepID=UPI0024BB83AD|nr:Fic family protein [Hymenobacter sp. H14-R3]MDJ0367512.1 Fic family protein [Hymenobacter sp. H14-R3]
MKNSEGLYRDPAAIAPLKPSELPMELRELALAIVEAAARLGGSLHPITARAIADFLRPANSYYSNLIEGHDTHPLSIAQALRKEYAPDSHNRSLQLEALAHIAVHGRLPELLAAAGTNPYTESFWRAVHRAFYAHLPKEFRWVKTQEGEELEVLPGELRTSEVRVGRHVAPAAAALPAFIERIEWGYRPQVESNRLARIVAIAAAHHRLAWLHPFLDGNGRVMRLFSDAAFLTEGLDAGGLWSMSRGLARSEQSYKQALAAADAQRLNDYDGRGNLSEKRLVAFCQFFLQVALDQIGYMTQVLAIDGILTRLRSLVDLLVLKRKWRPEAYYVLEAVFLKGSVGRGEVMRLTGLSDKTAKALAGTLLETGLLATEPGNRFAPYRAAYPIAFAPVLFPDLYPAGKEVDMLNVN